MLIKLARKSMLGRAFKSAFSAGKGGFNAGNSTRIAREAESPIYSSLGDILKEGKPEVKEFVTGTSKSFPKKLNLGQAFMHDVIHGERQLSRKFNKLVGIPSITGKDNRFIRHMKNSSAGYTLGAGALGSAILVGSRKHKITPVDEPLVKSAGPYDKLVNTAIFGSKLSPQTKLMGTAAENAVKVVHAAPTMVKSFAPMAKNVVKAFK